MPVSVEHSRQIVDDRSDREHIQIAIVGDGVHAVIDVADIAPPTIAAALSVTISLLCMRRLTLRKSRMKSSLDHLRLVNGLNRRIFDIGVGIERGDNRIVGFVVRIVDEQPHLDPTISRLHHAIDDDPAGRIAVPDVVLHVEAALGQVAQRQTDDEGFASMVQEAEAGEARMLVGRRAEELAESSRARLSNAAQRSVPGEMVVCVSLVQVADTISRLPPWWKSSASDLYPLSGRPYTNTAG